MTLLPTLVNSTPFSPKNGVREKQFPRLLLGKDLSPFL